MSEFEYHDLRALISVIAVLIFIFGGGGMCAYFSLDNQISAIHKHLGLDKPSQPATSKESK